MSEEIADAASEQEQALIQIGLVLREIAVKLSKDDAHTMLLILSSSIRENDVMYEPKLFDAIPSEGKSIENLFNAVYKLQHTYLNEKDAIQRKHDIETDYLQKKITMTVEEVQMNDQHIKKLRP